ncbi:MAG: hypothetical protein JRI57_03590 [Deltaproteobacteria bacterium]|nr:hypothetical protein [Deltaproteobacteria bacterium]MBW1951821.1 hypothetical protein [Deltaproteobacteria bacterium]MBW1985614.1 hypothetical protein [Deltaproteobacteria bacterium]
MTQALVGYNQHGIILATDSQATTFAEDGQSHYFTVEKLFPLGTHAAVLSGGSGVSVPLSLALRHEVDQRRLVEIEAIIGFALSFLSQAYGRYLAQHGPEPEDLRRIYFILAGYAPQTPPPTYQVSLLASENNVLPLERLQVQPLVVMPRHLGMEMRLLKALQQGTPLAELLEMSWEFLEKRAAATQEVASPFYFATITPDGYQPVVLTNRI